MSYDPLKALEEAGISIEQFPEDERQVLATLSVEEVEMLVKIHQKSETPHGASIQKGVPVIVGAIV